MDKRLIVGKYQDFVDDDDFFVQCNSNDEHAVKMREDVSIRANWRNLLPLEMRFEEGDWEVGLVQAMFKNVQILPKKLKIYDGNNFNVEKILQLRKSSREDLLGLLDEINETASPHYSNNLGYVLPKQEMYVGYANSSGIARRMKVEVANFDSSMSGEQVFDLINVVHHQNRDFIKRSDRNYEDVKDSFTIYDRHSSDDGGYHVTRRRKQYREDSFNPLGYYEAKKEFFVTEILYKMFYEGKNNLSRVLVRSDGVKFFVVPNSPVKRSEVRKEVPFEVPDFVSFSRLSRDSYSFQMMRFVELEWSDGDVQPLPRFEEFELEEMQHRTIDPPKKMCTSVNVYVDNLPLLYPVHGLEGKPMEGLICTQLPLDRECTVTSYQPDTSNVRYFPLDNFRGRHLDLRIEALNGVERHPAFSVGYSLLTLHFRRNYLDLQRHRYHGYF